MTLDQGERTLVARWIHQARAALAARQDSLWNRGHHGHLLLVDDEGEPYPTLYDDGEWRHAVAGQVLVAQIDEIVDRERDLKNFAWFEDEFIYWRYDPELVEIVWRTRLDLDRYAEALALYVDAAWDVSEAALHATPWAKAALRDWWSDLDASDDDPRELFNNCDLLREIIQSSSDNCGEHLTDEQVLLLAARQPIPCPACKDRRDSFLAANPVDGDEDDGDMTTVMDGPDWLIRGWAWCQNELCGLAAGGFEINRRVLMPGHDPLPI